MKRLRRSAEWRLGGALYAASPPLTIAWWVLVVVRGLLPAVFAITMGVLVSAVQHGDSLTVPLTVIGVTFIAMQSLGPVHDALSANLGAVGSSWLHDRLLHSCVGPPGTRGISSNPTWRTSSPSPVTSTWGSPVRT